MKRYKRRVGKLFLIILYGKRDECILIIILRQRYPFVLSCEYSVFPNFPSVENADTYGTLSAGPWPRSYDRRDDEHWMLRKYVPPGST